MTSVRPRVLTPIFKYVFRNSATSWKRFSTASRLMHEYSSETETHFGFETVSEQEKSERVLKVFERVAARYDLMNDMMSFGIHRVWKDLFISRIRPGPHTKLIDVAGGTGDIAFRFLKYRETTAKDVKRGREWVKQLLPSERFVDDRIAADSSPDVLEPISRSVLVCDINEKMLEVGQKRAAEQLTADEYDRIEFGLGDAESLGEIEDNSFDVYTIAFGIRNCVHVDKVVQEAYRILKPGGRFMCLEFSQVNNAALRTLYDEYSFQVIPVMGQVVAGDWDSYEYLVQSIRKFPNQEDFKYMIQSAGFRLVSYENLSGGICAIHSGFKL